MGVNTPFSCVILGCKAFFESDRLLTVFSEVHGKIRVLASKANGKSSPFSGLLDPGVQVSMTTSQGKTFNYLSQCRLEMAFPNIRKSYNRIAMMHHFFELIMKATAYDQPHPGFYDLLAHALQDLDSPLPLSHIQQQFYTQFLVSEGLLVPGQGEISISKFIGAYQSYTGESVVLPALIHDE